MIRYHGGPCTPLEAALELWSGRNALVSFAYPGQIALVIRHAHSFVMDNGAFSAWQKGISVDWHEYAKWVDEYHQHPAFVHALIPDVIDGNEKDNDDLLAWWNGASKCAGAVPVWHMHESLTRLEQMVGAYRTVAIGSSGEFSKVGTLRWWERIALAMDVACDPNGRPKCRLWGLRQMDPRVFGHVPYAMVDSASISRNCGVDKGRPGAYRACTTKQAALLMAFDADNAKSADRWAGGIPQQFRLESVE